MESAKIDFGIKEIYISDIKKGCPWVTNILGFSIGSIYSKTTL